MSFLVNCQKNLEIYSKKLAFINNNVYNKNNKNEKEELQMKQTTTLKSWQNWRR